MSQERSIVVVSAGLSQPSSTRLLADRLAAATVEELAARGIRADVTTIELRDLAHEVVNMTLTGFASAAPVSMWRPAADDGVGGPGGGNRAAATPVSASSPRTTCVDRENPPRG